MAVLYTITLYDDAGTAIGIVTPLSIAVVHKINTPSIATFTVNLNAAVVVNLDYGYIIQITRSNADLGINAYVEFSGFIRSVRRVYGSDPILEVTAIDAKCILMDRIVAWYPNLLGASYFRTSSHPTASSIMTALWNYNVSSSANGNPPNMTTSLSRRYSSALNRWTDGRITNATAATDLSLGTAIEYACSGENVLAAMQKTADTGSLDFTVNFTISTVSFSLFYAETLGADRRSYVKFSQQNNTIGTLTRTSNLINAVTLYHALGKGKDKNTLRANYPTTAPTGISLREAYVKGADSVNKTQLQNFARSRYAQQQRKINSYDIQVLQSGAWLYGRDYYLGDLLSVLVSSTSTITRKVYAVSLSVKSSGVEEVLVDLATN